MKKKKHTCNLPCYYVQSERGGGGGRDREKDLQLYGGGIVRKHNQHVVHVY